MTILLDPQEGQRRKAEAKDRPRKWFIAEGQVFGYYTVKGGTFSSGGSRYARVVCRCGTTKNVLVGNLVTGKSKSCGCRRAEASSRLNRTHGMSRTPEYEAWIDMRSRCVDPKDREFKNYGARGISVCAQWMSSFQAFFECVGRRPSSSHSLDRIDNDGNYEPGNVRWSSASAQSRNRRVTLKVEFRGELRPLADWCDELGLAYNLVYERIKRYGWSVERALTQGKYQERQFGLNNRRRRQGLPTRSASKDANPVRQWVLVEAPRC